MLIFPLAVTSQIVGLISLLKRRTEGGREFEVKHIPELLSAEEPTSAGMSMMRLSVLQAVSSPGSPVQ